MNSLVFIAVIITFAIVLVWYIHNEQAGADGSQGLLALNPDPETEEAGPEKRSYRTKSRAAQRTRARSVNDITKNADAGTPSFKKRMTTVDIRRKFRRQDEARYRVKDKKRDD